MDWMKDWKDRGMLESSAVKIAAARLEKAQLEFQELPSVLKGAGVNKKDPLTVEVFAEAMARMGEQQSAENHLIAVVLLEEMLKQKR